MSAPYRPEPLLAANRDTGEINLAILWAQVASKGQNLTVGQTRAAIRIALDLGMLLRERALRKTQL